MINFIIKQWKKETFHFLWLLLILLNFSYFFWDYFIDCLDWMVSNETKYFIVPAFLFFSWCIIIWTIVYFILIKILVNFWIIKIYKEKVKTILYMILLTIWLSIFFGIFVQSIPKSTIEKIKKQESWLELNLENYLWIKKYYNSFNSSDWKWQIQALWYQINCDNWKWFYIKNFFDKKLVDNKEWIYCKTWVLCKDNEYIIDKKWNKIKKISIYNKATKEEIIINFEDKDKYFETLCK